jgi:hypothetical protein
VREKLPAGFKSQTAVRACHQSHSWFHLSIVVPLSRAARLIVSSGRG